MAHVIDNLIINGRCNFPTKILSCMNKKQCNSTKSSMLRDMQGLAQIQRTNVQRNNNVEPLTQEQLQAFREQFFALQ